MNILFVSRLFKPHIGGVETHLNHLSNELLKMGHNVNVLTTRFQKELEKNELIGEIHVSRIEYPKMKIIGLLYIWIWVIKNIKCFEKYDVIHCHDVIIWLLPLKIIKPKTKLFLTFHGYEGYPLKRREILVHRFSNILSCGTIAIGKCIDKWYGTSSDIISTGAVDKSLFKKNPSKCLYQYLFSGRLHDTTSVEKYLNNTIKNKIIFVGDGPLRNRCEEYGTVTGMVSNPIHFYEKAKIILASRYLSILEAIAMDKPVYAIYDNPLKKDYLMMTPFAKHIRIGKRFDKYITYKYPKELKEWIKKQTWEKMAQDYIKLWNK